MKNNSLTHKSLISATACLASCLFAANGYAFEFGKPITINANISKGQGEAKQVKLMQVNLTPKEQTLLMSYKPKQSGLYGASNPIYPPAIDLGMNNVPVLDQGKHGSCVTFATTAAIDAVLNKGDYISQLCQLSLGSYLEKNAYVPSGWDGSLGYLVLNQMMAFGIAPKADEKFNQCGGLTAYPLKQESEEGKGMTPEQFKAISQNIESKFYSIQLMNPAQRFEKQMADKNQAEQTFNQMKAALMKGHRVLIGVFLQMSPFCSSVACASRNTANDTWAITEELDLPPTFFGGHEMVVTGYDDKAVAIDKKGNKHRGLLTLRNSWGDNVGDNGNYYMSYDYFKKFVMEAYEIVGTDDQDQQ